MKLQLVVTYTDGQHMYFPTTEWKIDTAHRMIIVGRGVPRTFIPLDKVLYFSIERY